MSKIEPRRDVDVQIAYAIGYDFEDLHGRTFQVVYERLGWEQMAKVADSWHVPAYSVKLARLLR